MAQHVCAESAYSEYRTMRYRVRRNRRLDPRKHILRAHLQKHDRTENRILVPSYRPRIYAFEFSHVL